MSLKLLAFSKSNDMVLRFNLLGSAINANVWMGVIKSDLRFNIMPFSKTQVTGQGYWGLSHHFVIVVALWIDQINLIIFVCFVFFFSFTLGQKVQTRIIPFCKRLLFMFWLVWFPLLMIYVLCFSVQNLHILSSNQAKAESPLP